MSGLQPVASSAEQALSRTWRTDGPVDVAATLSVHRRGSHDPSFRVDGESVWRAVRTPEGPASVRVSARRGAGEVVAAAWGPGAAWVLDVVPSWLGADDDPLALEPSHPAVRHAVRRCPGLRIGRSALVMDALVPAILEQKVTGMEAWRGYRALLRRHGTPAPGPVPGGMRVMPAADRLAMVPSWEWHQAGVGPQRARTIVTASRLASRLEQVASLGTAEAVRRLCSVPGIGKWTAAEVVQRVHGDPDAVSVGDYNLPSLVAYSLAGERRADDARMLELLEPYRGQRYRVCLLLTKAGMMPPRRGPRAPVRDFRRM